MNVPDVMKFLSASCDGVKCLRFGDHAVLGRGRLHNVTNMRAL